MAAKCRIARRLIDWIRAQPISLYTTLTACDNLRFFGTMAGLPDDRLYCVPKLLWNRPASRLTPKSRSCRFPADAKASESGGGSSAFTATLVTR